MPSSDYALAVSLIFTKATNQAIILQEPPSHVCSTSILWNSLAHDKRFEQIPMSEAAPGDIIIESGWQKAADGYAGIVVDDGRIVSNSSHGVRNDCSLLELQRHHPEMAVYRDVGFRNYYRTKPLANEGFNPAEPRIPAGQPGGGQWTAGMAPSTPVLSGRNTLPSDEFGATGGSLQVAPARAKTSESAGDAAQVHNDQWRLPGTGTIDQLKQARERLAEGYEKEVQDIKNMPGIGDQEQNAALKSLEEKYQKARNDLDRRISRIEQTARDMAFAYGGKPSDYYKILDDSDPKVQELMDALEHLDSYGFKDQALLYLRHAVGGKPPPPTDPHVLNAALAAAIGALGEGGMKGQAGSNLEAMGLRDVELAGASFNTGRKQLENAGFKWVETTPTGRKVFENPKTGAKVYYDSGGALVGDQKPHWHIVNSSGDVHDRSGRVAEPGTNAAHIPSN